jgi:DNA-binding transcriptional ArsR family regulator
MLFMARSTDPDVQFLQALADPTRLSIVRMLASQPEVCACDFTDCCNVGQPTVSHHLKVLRDAGIVTSDRRGSWVYYRIAPQAAERLGGIARSIIPGGLIPLSAVASRRDGAAVGGTAKPARPD